MNTNTDTNQLDAPTPETDAAAYECYTLHDMGGTSVALSRRCEEGECVRSDFARRLERERDDWKAKYFTMRELSDNATEIAESRGQERDAAIELLREIRDGEVNPEDEADKFLRDHTPSELSKARKELDELDRRLGLEVRKYEDAQARYKWLTKERDEWRECAKRVLDATAHNGGVEVG